MLDLFFRKYAWTANLVLLFVAAWLTAKTVNTLVGAVIRPEPRAEVAIAPTAPPRPALPATLEIDRLYKLIGQEPPREVEADAGQAPTAPQNCDDPRATPSKSDLRLQLVVGVIAERARQSLATIVDLNTREAHVVGVGDEVSGAKLLGLERVRDDADATGNGFRLVAIVCNKGTKEYLDYEGGAGSSGGEVAANIGYAPVPPPARPGGPAAPMEGVREVGQNKYEIDRERHRLDALEPEHHRDAGPHRPVVQERRGERVQALLHPAQLALRLDRHRERRRHPAGERVRDQLAREGARALPEAARVAARDDRARARRTGHPQGVHHPGP